MSPFYEFKTDATKEQKSANVQMLEYYTINGDCNQIIPERKGHVIKTIIPIPAHWHQYTKPEALKVLLASESRAALKAWLN